MRFIKRILPLALVLIMCSGCQKTPDAVKKNSRMYADEIERKDKDDIKYTDINHILKNQQQVLKQKYQNLELKDTIVISIPKKIKVLGLQSGLHGDIQEHTQSLIDGFFRGSQYKSEHIAGEETDGYELYGFNINSDDDRATIRTDGFVCLCRKNQSIGIRKLSEIYHIEQAEDMEKNCQLEEEKISLKVLADNVDAWCNTYWKTIENTYEYAVKTAYQCRDAQGEYVFMEVCKLYEGIPFEDIEYVNNDIENGDDFFENKLEVVIRKPEEIAAIRNNNFCYDIVSQEDHSDKVIGLEQAVRLVEQTMAGTHKQEITDIDIKYSVQRIEENKTDTEDVSDTKFVARPVWSFIIDSPENQSKAGPWARKFINVDMISGDVIYQNTCMEYEE